MSARIPPATDPDDDGPRWSHRPESRSLIRDRCGRGQPLLDRPRWRWPACRSARFFTLFVLPAFYVVLGDPTIARQPFRAEQAVNELTSISKALAT